MKKTNEKGKLINLFRTKKFVKEKFAEDLNLIIVNIMNWVIGTLLS